MIRAAGAVEQRKARHLDAVQTPDKAERDAKDITKRSFIDRICAQTNLHIISLWRQDANLRYFYQGPKSEGRGRPRQYTGKLNLKALDMDYFTLNHEETDLRIYAGIVNCPFLNRNIKVAYTQYLNPAGEPAHAKLYFSTDLNLPAWMIVRYYRLRYQQEFLIRDAKQFTGYHTV